MADQQEPGAGAHAQQQKAVFVSRIALIKELDGKVVIKNRLCFFEGNAVFFRFCLAFVGSHSNCINLFYLIYVSDSTPNAVITGATEAAPVKLTPRPSASGG